MRRARAVPAIVVLAAILGLGVWVVTRGGSGRAVGADVPRTPQQAFLADVRGSQLADVAARAGRLTDAALLADGERVCGAGRTATLVLPDVDASITLDAQPPSGEPDVVTTSHGSPAYGDAPLALVIVTAAQDDLCPR